MSPEVELGLAVALGILAGDVLKAIAGWAWMSYRGWRFRRMHGLKRGEGIGVALAGVAGQEKVFKGLKGGL